MDTKYKVIESEKGFVIAGGSDRVTVKVHLDECSWLLKDALELHQERFGVFEISKLGKAAAKIALEYWMPRDTPMNSYFKTVWGPEKLGRVFGKIMSQQLKRLQGKIPPIILDVQRKIFASTMGCGELAMNPKFYLLASKHLISDVLAYRPARVAVRNLGELWALDCFSFSQKDLEIAEVEKTVSEWSDETFCLEKWREYYECIPFERRKRLPLERCVELLEEWKLLFSPDRTAYTALNRTLMNCPAVPSHALCKLHRGRLAKPIFNRLELLLNLDSMRIQRHKKVISQSSEAEILKALRNLGNFTRRNLSSRKYENIQFFVGYLHECREENPNERLAGLVRRSIRWHRNQATRKKEEVVALYGGRKVGFPPAPLPQSDGCLNIRFLDTVEAIAREGEELGHCIGTYIPKALDGDSYLFHVEHINSGEKASVEVGRRGKVLQSCGPGNCTNKATRLGASRLGEWGKVLACIPCSLGGEGHVEPLPF